LLLALAIAIFDNHFPRVFASYMNRTPFISTGHNDSYTGESIPNIEGGIINYLIDRSHKSPDKTAFIVLENGGEIEKKITYLELAIRVKKYAFQLTGKQLEGKRALLAYQDILEFIVSFLACQYAGVIPIPVSYVKGNNQLSRLINIIEDAQATAIFCTHSSVAHLQGLFNLLKFNKIEIIYADRDHSWDC
jgi:acyl-CoA synthetase (AMP-forming)/AMP-acid ligase II